MTSSSASHRQRMEAIAETWGRRCQKLVFVSGGEDDEGVDMMPGWTNAVHVRLNIPDDYASLWQKTTAAFRYIHDHFVGDADWFMKADDDAFVIMENLRIF